MRLSQHLDNIESSNYRVSEFAAYYFEQKGEDGVTPLLNKLKHNEDDDKIVSSIIYILGRVGPKASRAVPVLIKYLDHENPDIRKTTISALGKIGKASDPAVPLIADNLNSKNEWMRTLSLRALKDIGTVQSKSIAEQYEKKLKLEEERKNKALLQNNSSEAIEPEPAKKLESSNEVKDSPSEKDQKLNNDSNDNK
jgi:HEAT repeat protein